MGPDRLVGRGTVPLIRRGTERHRTSEDTVELASSRRILTISRSPRSSTSKAAAPVPACRSTSRASRTCAPNTGSLAPAPPDPDSDLFTIEQTAELLGVAHTTIYRWLRDGLLPGEQTTPHAPWRIRLTNETRQQFVPEIPDGYLALDEAAKRLGYARQTVLHKVPVLRWGLPDAGDGLR